MPTQHANYVSVFVTTSCRMACPYCYAEHAERNAETIDLEFARAGVDDFLRNASNGGIRFQGGGEPTERMDIIENLVEYARQRYGRVRMELQTNGYFDPTIAEWVGKNIDIVWVSIDGPSEVNSIHRPDGDGRDTTARVEENIRRLVAAPRPTVGIRACITTLNVERQSELVEYCHRLGVKSVYADNVFSTGENDDLMTQAGFAVPNMSEYCRGVIEARRRADALGVFYGSWLSVNFAEPGRWNCSSCIPHPRLCCDGFVSSCDVCFLGRLGPAEFVYGRWDEGSGRIIYDEQRRAALAAREWCNLKPCNKCNLAESCAGGCAGKAFLKTGDLMQPDTDICRYVHILARNIPVGQGRAAGELEHP